MRPLENLIAAKELPSAFQPDEIAILARAYDIALSYFSGAYPMVPADRRCLARLTVMAGSVRRHRDNDLASIVDAHAIAAEVVGFFVALNSLETRP